MRENNGLDQRLTLCSAENRKEESGEGEEGHDYRSVVDSGH